MTVFFYARRDEQLVKFCQMAENHAHRLLTDLGYSLETNNRHRNMTEIASFRDQCRDWILRCNREMGIQNPPWGYLVVKVAYIMIQLDQYEKEDFTLIQWGLKDIKDLAQVKVEA